MPDRPPSLVLLDVKTHAREEMVEIGAHVRELVRDSNVAEGVVHLWALHTTCALTVNENADPDVVHDVTEKMRALVPHREPYYRHAEGNSDSHVKTSLFGPGLTLIVHEGQLLLGRWQGVFLTEWDGPRTRRVAVKIVRD